MTVAQKRQTRITERPIWRVREDERISADDQVTVEEPLEIRVEEESVAVIMRTPRHDFELAAGFLLTEGLIKAPRELGAISYCTAAEPPNEENIVEVKMAAGVDFDLAKLKRNFYASSSCGVCGKASIEAITTLHEPVSGDVIFREETLMGAPETLRRAQATFEETGGLHASAVFDREGDLLVLEEPVDLRPAVGVVDADLRQGHSRMPPVAATRWRTQCIPDPAVHP